MMLLQERVQRLERIVGSSSSVVGATRSATASDDASLAERVEQVNRLFANMLRSNGALEELLQKSNARRAATTPRVISLAVSCVAVAALRELDADSSLDDASLGAKLKLVQAAQADVATQLRQVEQIEEQQKYINEPGYQGRSFLANARALKRAAKTQS